MLKFGRDAIYVSLMLLLRFNSICGMVSLERLCAGEYNLWKAGEHMWKYVVRRTIALVSIVAGTTFVAFITRHNIA